MSPFHEKCEFEPILRCNRKGKCLECVLEEDRLAGNWISYLEDGWTVEHPLELLKMPIIIE